MNAAVLRLPERGFAPEDWYTDLQCSYSTNFAFDLGFDVGFAPRSFSSDEIYDPDDYRAEVVHWSPYLDPPDEATLFRLGRMACQLYVEALKRRDERRRLRRASPPLPLSKSDDGSNASVSAPEPETEETES